jgi:hypothetical protein
MIDLRHAGRMPSHPRTCLLDPAPLPPIAAGILRSAVARLRESKPRRSFPVAVHVGGFGAPYPSFVELSGEPLDHALRTEVAAALLSRALLSRALLSRAQATGAELSLWLSRPGELETEDVDLRWYAAATAAYREAGVALVMVVLTPRGWRQPATGGGVAWKRLRIRP